MADIKTVEININVDHPSLSEVKVNGEAVQNLFGIYIHANVAQQRAEVEFETNGNQLGVEKGTWSFFIKPHCPKCGFDGVRTHAISVGEASESSDDSKSTGVSEGTSLPTDSSE